jgi:hypothetical protein
MGGYTAEFVGWYKRHVDTHDENPRSTLFTKLIMKRKGGRLDRSRTTLDRLASLLHAYFAMQVASVKAHARPACEAHINPTRTPLAVDSFSSSSIHPAMNK